MKVTLKHEHCPLDFSHLTVEDGVLSCEDGCDLEQDLSQWHPETRNAVKPVMDYFRDTAGDRP